MSVLITTLINKRTALAVFHRIITEAAKITSNHRIIRLKFITINKIVNHNIYNQSHTN